MPINAQTSEYSKGSLLWLGALHVVLGIVLDFSPLAASIYGLVPTVITIILVLNNRNRNNEAFVGSVYIMGAEVIWRISQGSATYEFAKHSITLILMLGVAVENKPRRWDKRIFIYAISFLPAALIALDVIPEKERFRQLSAILSGPLCLVASVIYFSNRSIDTRVFIKSFQLFTMTSITLVVTLFMSNPDLESISYSSQSNFATSGGFGPNQVATILGLGILIVCMFIWMRKRLTGFLITDCALLVLLVFRGFLTFSRGGMVGALISIAAFILVNSYYQWKSTVHVVRLVTFVIGGAIIFGFVWNNLTNITGGQIVNRYTGKDSLGRPVKDISSGRALIGADEIISFEENPIFGVGLSYSKFLRSEKTGQFVNTHNELTRTMAEQGLLGLTGLLSVFFVAFRNYSYRSPFSKAIFWAFITLFSLTLLHSAMRLSMVGLIFGLSLAIIVPNRYPKPTLPS